MRVVIITAFLNYDWDIRVKYIRQFLVEKGHEVVVVSSDFDHRKKEYYVNNRGLLIHVPSYKKNVSLNRVYSHIVFSRKAIKKVNSLSPQIIYVITPPNSLLYYIKRIKKPGLRVVVEVEDLWPESFPVNRAVKVMVKPFLYFWKLIREKNLDSADACVFECQMFRDYILKRRRHHFFAQTMYLTRDDTLTILKDQSLSNTVVEFVYLGSINNLIDINLIVNILSIIKSIRRIKFHIIGSGEKLEVLEKMLEMKRIDYVNHGVIYDDYEKEKILSECHFAFNIMKDTTFVGLTMKSVEYFHYGIPLINNIPGDTEDIISKYKCGININKKTHQSSIVGLVSISDEEYTLMRKASRAVYEKYFSITRFEYSFDKLLDNIQ